MQNNHSEWFEKAKDDELSIQALIKEEGPPSTICFLAQQIAEKYLKGLLVLHDKDFPKVHDLLELETLLRDVEPAVATIHQYLNILNRYYIETRYPGDFPEFTLKEAEEAFTAAVRIKKFVLSKVQA